MGTRVDARLESHEHKENIGGPKASTPEEAHLGYPGATLSKNSLRKDSWVCRVADEESGMAGHVWFF